MQQLLLTALMRVVLSQKLVDKYFKGENPLGKLIKIDNKDNVIVTGVLDEIPESSSLRFDFLMSFELWRKKNDWAKEWGNNGPRCYVLLSKNASVDKVNAKIKNYIKTKEKESNVELFLQNYGESYLYSNWENGKQNGGRIEYVKIFLNRRHHHHDYCLHQFYEPGYGPVIKKSTGDRRKESSWSR